MQETQARKKRAKPKRRTQKQKSDLELVKNADISNLPKDKRNDIIRLLAKSGIQHKDIAEAVGLSLDSIKKISASGDSLERMLNEDHAKTLNENIGTIIDNGMYQAASVFTDPEKTAEMNPLEAGKLWQILAKDKRLVAGDSTSNHAVFVQHVFANQMFDNDQLNQMGIPVINPTPKELPPVDNE